MMQDTIPGRLHAAIAQVCPVVGVCLHDLADRSTWQVDYDPGATVEQRQAAAAVISGFDPERRLAEDAIGAERDRRIAAGHRIALSTGKSFTVQTRDERDFRNIQGLSSVGVVRQAKGDAATITFRDADNEDHSMTPAEVIEMGLRVAAAVDAIYKASWALKDMTRIPADFSDDKHWPVASP